MKINVLDSKVFNRISAGEVVEKPASIVKEVVENSIDAKATSIKIEIVDGGIKKIVVSDNGTGIEKDDVALAFLPHATSKIKNVEDLDNIETLGFRGEALASIASVCHVTLSSRAKESEIGYIISIDGGEFGKIQEIARNRGTTIEISDLFYNTPVRAKFLRKPKSEEAEITHLVQRFMLAHPEIAFTYVVDGKQIYNTKSSELSDIIYTIYGKEVFENLIEVDYTEGDFSLKGFVVSPKISKPNRTYQTLFVNNRYVENYLISSSIQSVFESFLMKGKFPVYVLNLIVLPSSVDVNVHPTKKEVKFEEPNKIYSFVKRAIEGALTGIDYIASLDFEDDGIIDTFQGKKVNDIPAREAQNILQNEGNSFSGKVGSNEIIEKNILTTLQDQQLQSLEKKESEAEIDITSSNLNPVTLDASIEKRFFFDQSQEKHFYRDFIKERKPDEKLFKSSPKDEIKVVGVLFNTYIVAELGESIFLVDQHAAHERQLYDKLINRISNEDVIAQPLLLPYSFRVNEREYLIIENSLKALEELGFKITKGQNQFQIEEIPMVLDGLDLKKFIEDVLTEGEIWSKKSSDIIKEKLAQNACKHAVKGGQEISIEALVDLVEQMKEGVLLCPHGRPIMVKVTKKDLEKLFKRIV